MSRRHFLFPELGRTATDNAASTQPPRELLALYRSLGAIGARRSGAGDPDGQAGGGVLRVGAVAGGVDGDAAEPPGQVAGVEHLNGVPGYGMPRVQVDHERAA